MLVFKGNISNPEKQIWRDKSQEKFDEIAGNNYLQLTCETWITGGCLPINETKTTSMVTEKNSHSLTLKYFGTKVGSKNFNLFGEKPTDRVF